MFGIGLLKLKSEHLTNVRMPHIIFRKANDVVLGIFFSLTKTNTILKGQVMNVKKTIYFFVVCSLILLMTSCIIISGGNNKPTLGNNHEDLENHYGFTYLGEALQELQVAVGLKEETVTTRGSATMLVGKLVGFLKGYKEKQLKKDEREKITAIFNSVDEISRNLDSVSTKLDEMNATIDKNFYATMDAFLQSNVKSSVDARWNEYSKLLERTSYEIGDPKGWPSVEEMNQYANTVLTNIEQLDVMKNINEIRNFITDSQDILNAYADVLIRNLSQPPYAIEEVITALLLLRGYYLELVSYQIKMALFMVEINQEHNQLYARDRLEEILDDIAVQNEIYLCVSERVATYAGANLLNRKKTFTNSSIISLADITIYELTLENTLNIRLWWTKDGLKDPDALMNGIDQNNLYFTETYNQAYEWLETTEDITKAITIPGLKDVEATLNLFTLSYYGDLPTQAGLWRLTYKPEKDILYQFHFDPLDSPVFEYNSVLDYNKINRFFFPNMPLYRFGVSDSTPVLSISIGAYMPEDRLYSFEEIDSGYSVEPDQHAYSWLLRYDMDYSPDEAVYRVWPLRDSLLSWDILSIDGARNQPWGILIENTGEKFLKDGHVIKLYTKHYFSGDGYYYPETSSKNYYVKKTFIGSNLTLDSSSKDAWKYDVKKKYLSFLGRIFDDEYIRFRDYYILHHQHKKTHYFVGPFQYNILDHNDHAVRMLHFEENYCAPNQGILNSDYYSCLMY